MSYLLLFELFGYVVLIFVWLCRCCDLLVDATLLLLVVVDAQDVAGVGPEHCWAADQGKK